jgi:hypothetical protein
MTEEEYDDLLDDIYEVIKIGTLEYSPSQVLKAVDPIAYRVGMNDYEDSIEEEE